MTRCKGCEERRKAMRAAYVRGLERMRHMAKERDKVRRVSRPVLVDEGRGGK